MNKFTEGQIVKITSVKYFGKKAEVVDSYPWQNDGLAYELRPMFKCIYPVIHRHESELAEP